MVGISYDIQSFIHHSLTITSNKEVLYSDFLSFEEMFPWQCIMINATSSNLLRYCKMLIIRKGLQVMNAEHIVTTE